MKISCLYNFSQFLPFLQQSNLTLNRYQSGKRMASQINSLIKQALTTFGGVKTGFAKNLDTLKHIMDKTTGSDIGLHHDHEIFKPETWGKPKKGPVTYIEIYDDNSVSIGVFVLAEKMKLPLHDHPRMHGLIKVIYGSMKVNSFTIIEEINEKQVEVECHSPVNVDFTSPPCVLSPDHQNLHEIESVNGVAAFLDILSPPYDVYIPEYGERTCTYFKRVKQTGINKMLLEKIESPSWFWCDQYPYPGPEIDIGKSIEESSTL